jgi:hypothetical protein
VVYICTLVRILPEGVVSKKDMGAWRILWRICLKNRLAVWRLMKTTRKNHIDTSTTETAVMIAYTWMSIDAWNMPEVSYESQ